MIESHHVNMLDHYKVLLERDSATLEREKSYLIIHLSYRNHIYEVTPVHERPKYDFVESWIGETKNVIESLELFIKGYKERIKYLEDAPIHNGVF